MGLSKTFIFLIAGICSISLLGCSISAFSQKSNDHFKKKEICENSDVFVTDIVKPMNKRLYIPLVNDNGHWRLSSWSCQ